MTAVERGTYIRKLAHDMGEKIGIKIHMGDLRRIQVGKFSEKNSNFLTSDKLKMEMENFLKTKCFLKKIYLYFNLKKYFYPIDELFKREKKFQKIEINKEALKYVSAGNPIRRKNLINKDRVCPSDSEGMSKSELYSIWYKNKVIGIGNLIEENYDTKNEESEIIKIKKLLK